MKKAIYSLIGVALLWAASTATAQVQDAGIVFVNLERVFDEYYKTQLADAQLKEKAEEFTAERASRIAEYEALNERFAEAREQAQDSALSEDVRTRQRSVAEELIVEIREMEERIQEFDQTRRQQLEEQGHRMRTRIVGEIQEEIKAYARERDYEAVIDSSGQSINAVPLILYADSRLDISEAILGILNEGR